MFVSMYYLVIQVLQSKPLQPESPLANKTKTKQQTIYTSLPQKSTSSLTYILKQDDSIKHDIHSNNAAVQCCY